jgi:thiol reductant ABC exporter CydC subunit
MTPLRRVAVVARPVRGWLLLAAAAAAAAATANVLLMVAAPYLISRATIVTGFAALAITVTAVRGLAIARASLRYADRSVSHAATFRLLTQLRVWLYRSLVPLVPGAFRDGDLLTRLVSDVETLGGTVVRGVLPPVAAVAGALTGVVALTLISPGLGVGLAAALVIGGIGVPAVARRAARRPARDDVEARTRLQAEAADDVAGLAELIAFGASADLLMRLDDASSASVAARARLATVRGAAAGATAIVATLAALALLAVGVVEVSSGAVAGVVLAVIPLVTIAAFEGLGPLGDAVEALASGRAAAARTVEVIDAPPPVADPAVHGPVPATPDLALEGVRFRYAGAGWVLDGLDLDLPAGTRVGLTGPNGSGKSTTASLLLRFIEPGDGVYRVAGQPAAAYAGDAIRERIAVVPQDPYLFHGTLRDNLLVADADADDDRIRDALERAGLGRLLRRLPNGLDTPVGEDGMSLSGGERRRVAIGRLFLRDAPVVLLDEPTADLDGDTERAVLTAIEAHAEGRTLLVISHRPAPLELVERIVELPPPNR